MINRQLTRPKEDPIEGFFTDRSGRNVWRSGSLRAEEICPDPVSPRPGQAFDDSGDPAGASSVSWYRSSASSRVMRPLRTAMTTAALRRTTQRLVLGGGRSSLIDRSPSAGRSIALLTRSSQDPGGPE